MQGILHSIRLLELHTSTSTNLGFSQSVNLLRCRFEHSYSHLTSHQNASTSGPKALDVVQSCPIHHSSDVFALCMC